MIDVADIPPDLLERAIASHVRSSPYMPKASDLVALAANFAKQAQHSGMDPVAYGNSHLAQIGRTDAEWYRDSAGQPRIRHSKQHTVRKPVQDRRGEPMSRGETFELNRWLESQGATARYREDGSRYLAEV